MRDDADGIRRYVHVGTGNYNATTAKLYDDLGLFTTDEDLGADLTHLFNYLTGYGRNVKYEKLLVAPHSLRHRIKDLILAEAEAAKAEPGSGRIRMKLNSLVDPDMIEALYAASQAGVQIDCVVRGICCLRPGVPGMSENIRVRSIVGRYLEHSRIYEFANGAGPGQAAFYIGSADLMPRNLDRRVEALTPVNDPGLQDRLREILRRGPRRRRARVDARTRRHVDQGADRERRHQRRHAPQAAGAGRQPRTVVRELTAKRSPGSGLRGRRQPNDPDGETEVLLVHRPKYDDWSLPKGKRDPAETDEQCAVREVEEETGLRCRLGRELLPTAYTDARGRAKVVRYWSMSVVGERPFVPGRRDRRAPMGLRRRCRGAVVVRPRRRSGAFFRRARG